MHHRPEGLGESEIDSQDETYPAYDTPSTRFFNVYVNHGHRLSALVFLVCVHCEKTRAKRITRAAPWFMAQLGIKKRHTIYRLLKKARKLGLIQFERDGIGYAVNPSYEPRPKTDEAKELLREFENYRSPGVTDRYELSEARHTTRAVILSAIERNDGLSVQAIANMRGLPAQVVRNELNRVHRLGEIKRSYDKKHKCLFYTRLSLKEAVEKYEKQNGPHKQNGPCSKTKWATSETKWAMSNDSKPSQDVDTNDFERSSENHPMSPVCISPMCSESFVSLNSPSHIGDHQRDGGRLTTDRFSLLYPLNLKPSWYPWASGGLINSNAEFSAP